MYEMSPYSTPILWSASVAGPVKGEVVASWRKTSRNDFSCGVRSVISRPLLPALFVCICLLNFLSRPVARVLDSSTGSRCIALQRTSREESLRRGPLRCLICVPSHQGDSQQRCPNLPLLESNRL